ncbi:MAG: TolC family protein, partial [Phycisphaerae bacterium]
PMPLKDMRELLPDPIVAEQALRERLSRITDPELRRDFAKTIELTLKHLAEVARPRKVYLSLADCIRRALANNFAIRVEGYNPAIDTTRIVEAEALFDPQVFFNYTEHRQDRPSAAPELTGTRLNTRSLELGVRKLLPTGMQVETRYSFLRTDTNLAFQAINPSYTNNFIIELRQPLLRGFGLDFNRSRINIARNNRQISMERFSREVQDRLVEVERRYWELVQARQEVSIVAELLAQSEQMLETVSKRTILDTIPGLVPQTAARVAGRKAEFVRVKARLRDAEDRLKNILNDPALSLSDDVEIVPTDSPSVEPLVVDTLQEIQTALEHRTELKEADLQVKNAHIAVGVARNQALPRFDVSFQVTYDGLGSNPDSAWDQLMGGDFIEYLVMLELEWPIGNRGARAALRRARLQQSQAVMALKRIIEDVILDVNLTTRQLQTSYDQIAPSIQEAQASADHIRMLQLRKEAMDPNTLNLILNAQETLAAARRSLLQALVGYNIAIVNLERSKGTLLNYNNVVLADSR